MSQGVEHLHSNEVILTLGHSATACAFLVEAAKKREFQVSVCVCVCVCVCVSHGDTASLPAARASASVHLSEGAYATHIWTS